MNYYDLKLKSNRAIVRADTICYQIIKFYHDFFSESLYSRHE